LLAVSVAVATSACAHLLLDFSGIEGAANDASAPARAPDGSGDDDDAAGNVPESGCGIPPSFHVDFGPDAAPPSTWSRDLPDGGAIALHDDGLRVSATTGLETTGAGYDISLGPPATCIGVETQISLDGPANAYRHYLMFSQTASGAFFSLVGSGDTHAFKFVEYTGTLFHDVSAFTVPVGTWVTLSYTLDLAANSMTVDVAGIGVVRASPLVLPFEGNAPVVFRLGFGKSSTGAPPAVPITIRSLSIAVR
jgi:hypothetical protein